MPLSPSTADLGESTRVYVHLANHGGGWVLLVERDGQSRLVYQAKELSLIGPYRVSGGWWVKEIERDYYYAHSLRGECWWVFFDKPRAAWFLHGFVD